MDGLGVTRYAKVAEEERLKAIAKQPQRVRRPLSGVNQWREVTRGVPYMKQLFVEGEWEKERRSLHFEERLSSGWGVIGSGRGLCNKPKGAKHIDLSTSAKYSWRGGAARCHTYTLMKPAIDPAQCI